MAILASTAAAGDQFGGFKDLVDSGSLKPFTRDLGSILGAATFHNGRSLGFSGFDVGVRGGLQLHPGKGDDVLHQRGVRLVGLPWVQAEIGLPFRFDGFIRGVSYQGLTIAGGGARYGLPLSSEKPRAPQWLLTTSAHSVAHRFFSASHLGANLVASVNYAFERREGEATRELAQLTPYAGAGADRTRVVVRTVPVRDATLEGATATTWEPRFTLGASLRFKRFLYLHAAGVFSQRVPGLDSGIGMRF